MDFSSSSSSSSSSNANAVALSFASASVSVSDAKIAPIVVAGAAFVGKTIVGGVIGGAASWGVNRVLDSSFPAKK
jgi:hypothetical protein